MQKYKYLLYTNDAAHEAEVVEIDMSDPDWTYQSKSPGRYFSPNGEYDTYEEAEIDMKNYLKCDSRKNGTYCYSHNPR